MKTTNTKYIGDFKIDLLNHEVIQIYNDAIQKYGILPQVLMVVEECGELLSALSKYNRSRIEAPEVIT